MILDRIVNERKKISMKDVLGTNGKVCIRSKIRLIVFTLMLIS